MFQSTSNEKIELPYSDPIILNHNPTKQECNRHLKPHRGQERVLPSRPHPKSKDQCGTQEDTGCNKQGSEEKTANNLERNLNNFKREEVLRERTQ